MSEFDTTAPDAEAARTKTPAVPTPPLCPRCRRASGLPLERPATGGFNRVYRCNTHSQGCGFLWSPRTSKSARQIQDA
jgi:hypothetical protein